MEIIIYSRNGERRRLLESLTDEIIAGRRLRLMSPHTSYPDSVDSLISLIKPGKGYLVIADAASCPDWEQAAEAMSSRYRRVKFFLLSDPEEAARAVNTSPDICAWADPYAEDFPEIYEKQLARLYGRITTVCGGIMTYGSDGALKVVSYDHIYYIETIKQQHKCTIYHKGGTDIMRADISKLIKELDGRFEVTRSSTIANLSLAKSVRDGLIFFDDDVFCAVAAKRESGIKKIMRENILL